MNEILVPISLGELYDRITILKIKEKKIKEKEKLVNITKELTLLQKIADAHVIDSKYYFELYNVNNTLWTVEDSLIEKERKKEYDDEFIQLARKVYFTNDKRSDIKRQINLKYNSTIVEEKSYKQY